MKKIAFYLLILLQVVFIALIGWQHLLIDRFGETVKLSVFEKDYDHYGWTDHEDYMNVRYDISRIHEDRWNVLTEDMQYNERVYVLLKQNEDGHYVVQKASTHKLKPANDEIVFPAKYMYEMKDYIEVEYGIERIHDRVFKNFNKRKPYTVFVKVAPWGQKKVVRLQNE